MKRLSQFLLASGLVCAADLSFAGTFSNDFNSGTTAPPGTTLNGSSVIEATGGVNNSGVLKLTKAINSHSSNPSGTRTREAFGVRSIYRRFGRVT